MDRKIIIVGAGIAGVQAATSFAAKGFTPVLINGENYLPYYRMRLEEVVSGAEPEKIAIHPLSWYSDHNIELINARVGAIDRSSSSVTLSDETVLFYSKLILATGSHSFSFPIEGAEDVVMTLRNMDDALSLRERLKKATSVAIVGGGLLGLEAATAIKTCFNLPIAVIESQEYILLKQIDCDSSSILKNELERRGIDIYEGVGTKEYKDGYLLLTSGEKIQADLILLSVGVRANIELATGSNLLSDKAIVVDNSLRTSDGNIYAIGDVAELGGKLFSLAQYAREQGIYVAGSDKPYIPSEPSSMLKVAGIDVSFLGKQQGEKIVYGDEEKRVTCFVEDGILLGVVLINAKSLVLKAKNALGCAFDPSIFVL